LLHSSELIYGERVKMAGKNSVRTQAVQMAAQGVRTLDQMVLVCALHTADLYGSAQSLISHIQAVEKDFADVRVFLSEAGPLVSALEGRGVKCSALPFVHRGLRKRMWSFQTWRDVRDVISSRWRFVRTMREGARERNALVHVHSSVCIYAMWAAKRAGVPLVVHVRETRRPTWESWLREQMVLRLADRIVTVSEGIRRGYSRVFQNRSATIYNWVDAPENIAELSRHGRVLGFVGSIHFEKGIREFLEMCARLKGMGTDFEAHVYGQPLTPETDIWCRSFVQREGLERCVLWKGAVQDAARLYRSMDLCVLPTYYDALPRAVMEAMSWGIPVVATRVGGIPELLGANEAGLLIPPRDVDALTQAVRSLLDNGEMRRALGEAGRKRVRELFGRERYRSQMLALYRDLLADYQR
jgi:glycosyltransferase involved in cell wall biosynthesis